MVKRPATHCFQTPEEHAEFLKKDLLPRAGPKHMVMALIRRTFGRRRDAVRLFVAKVSSNLKMLKLSATVKKRFTVLWDSRGLIFVDIFVGV